MLFHCKVCQEKDSRIQDLKEQIAYLRTLTASPSISDQVTASYLEADGIMSGQQHILEVPSASERAEQGEERTAEDEQRERDRLLAANY